MVSNRLFCSVPAQLTSQWRGLPIRLKIAESDFLLGTGRPCATVVVRNWRTLRRILRRPSPTFGDAYVRGDVQVEGRLCDALSGFHRNSLRTPAWRQLAATIAARIPDTVKRAIGNARHHYDIGNSFYRLWLDSSWTYSCAYFENGDESLDEAQRKKRDLICRKLRLEPGNRLLDIGCGWGALVFHAAKHYAAQATAVTPSHEQACYVREEAQRQGIDAHVEVLEQDWREVRGKFDRIVSVGMFEHVGRKQYSKYLRQWARMLAEGGFSVLHTIGRRLPEPPDPWIRKYIFPGGDIPTLEQIITPAMSAGLQLFRCENLRPHYARTLAAWAENFQRARARIVEQYGEAFARMWWLYLQTSQAAFQWGDLQLLQLEFCRCDERLPLSRELQPTQPVTNRSVATEVATASR